MHFVYVLECVDGTLYTGWTTDVPARVAQHNLGKGAKYTRNRGPVVLRHMESFETKGEALRREYSIKQLTRQQKLILIGHLQVPECMTD